MTDTALHIQHKPSLRTKWLFWVPSLVGVFLFMLPIAYDGGFTIPIALLAKTSQALLENSIAALVTSIVILSSIAALCAHLIKPAFITSSEFLSSLFLPSKAWLVVRTLGALFVTLTYFGLGPDFLRSDDTGGLILFDLLPGLLTVFFFAGLFLPLLLNFGLLEVLGVLLSRIMRPLFGLPGRSAIDCLASWLGDGSVGILMTSKQYEARIYTQREAAVVGTTFSAVSITFTLVVLSQVKLEHLFLPFYATICLAGLAAAFIVPKLPPLSRKKDCFIDHTLREKDEEFIPEGRSALSWGYTCGLARAAKIKSLGAVFKEGLKNSADMIIGVLPVVMAIGTLALVVAEETLVFDILGKPFVPLLELLAIPEAAEASKAIVVGFADMFIPSIIAASIESEMTRFVIAALSVTQLIYMSEVGALLLGSKIPVSLFDLCVIFVLRTLVTLPIIALMAHMIF